MFWGKVGRGNEGMRMPGGVTWMTATVLEEERGRVRSVSWSGLCRASHKSLAEPLGMC